MTDHPTVKQYFENKETVQGPPNGSPIETKWLRELCLHAGADDVGFVSINRSELDDQRKEILSLFPKAKTLISFVCKMNREPVRSTARSIANTEFHHVIDTVTHVGHQIVKQLEAQGIKALNPPAGFPMELTREGKAWVISHKPIAVAAGLGQMGIHRLVIHPKFGNFILLGTILTDAILTSENQTIDYNPCLECKLCVAACPVGAIGSDGHFNFSACYTHNYREFSGGFTDWVESIADSSNSKQYRAKVNDAETASMWQSLSFGANYKAAYCMSVCPAGEDVIGAFLNDRKHFFQEVAKPLQDKKEIVYVVPGSDAEKYVKKRFPHKQARLVSNGLRSKSIRSFLWALPHMFQRNQAKDLKATYHFTFTGEEEAKATVIIQNRTLSVTAGHVRDANFQLVADSRTWIRLLAKETGMLPAVLSGNIRTKGPLKLLKAFRRCFPS
ncbi:4Fe-4S ferredoxin [Paenibacillus sp. SYP-B3998]|uniref:4Fe-4S ferredoxin n=2 Tax=Paenibacillus sp. SYP-B3998 TaxID=2678564 RepID=A0A6G3ZXE8_9BACL|nr:SCP2 sterol-binding domain-containing protein [Paenibacillus sp. SYP-B3998]NEW06812.1 4Fe-4S ferredoxin [Paenibacillus sp. SYP-B3998]